MEAVEVPCRKVLAEKEKKRRKAEVKATKKATEETDGSDSAGRAAKKRRVSEEGTSRKKKRKTRLGTPIIGLDSEDVSSPMPLNHSKPLEVLAEEV
ncbi:hypothetical protein Tco_1452717, partial [Tanacetum coccineum]